MQVLFLHRRSFLSTAFDCFSALSMYFLISAYRAACVPFFCATLFTFSTDTVYNDAMEKILQTLENSRFYDHFLYGAAPGGLYVQLGCDYYMKIEKINDNQIRCTLTREDLADRQLKLSELAYGTEKAKTLFRDMMQQAAYEFGFEANDIPLMIEAIPISPESIILIITKVEDPEELDTRFAKFAPAAPGSEPMGNSPIPAKVEGADDILGLFNRFHDAQEKTAEQPAASASDTPEQPKAPMNLTRGYHFADLDTVLRAAHVLEKHYDGLNTLYHSSAEKDYYLIITKSEHSPEEFNKICNILSEYAANTKFVSGMEAYYAEHMDCVVEENALQKLAVLA